MKIEKLFIDTSFFVALFNRLDNQHQKAKQISEKLLVEAPGIFISNFIFSETVTVVSQKVDRETAVAAGLKLPSAKTFIYIDSLLQQKSWNIFQKIDKKNIGFVDCSILAVMAHEDIKWLLTFDGTDFKSLQKPFKFKLYPLG